MRFTSFHIKPALKGEVANVVSRRGYKAAYSSLFITTPQSHFVRQLPVKGRLIVRFTSSHIKPALEGEVDASVTSRRRGCSEAAVVYVNPSVKPSVCQLPVKGSLMKNGFHCLRKPRSSTQKFIVEAASEKKVRHLACFDDSDASDADVRKSRYSTFTRTFRP